MNLSTAFSSALSTALSTAKQIISALNFNQPTLQGELVNQNNAMAFSFGDPVPILDVSNAYMSLLLNMGGYYEPPIDFEKLSRLRRANAYHGQALAFKRDMLARFFQPVMSPTGQPFISKSEFLKIATSWALCENGYLQKHYNRFGRTVRLSYLPAVWMRRGATNYDNALGEPTNFYVKLMNTLDLSYIKFAEDEVLHLHSEDDLQPLYGLPSYLGGAQEVMLSEESTLFRRKFFANGAHMGYILVTSDAGITKEIAEQIENRVKESKGIGNFRNLYVNIERTQNREPVKVIPIGNIGVNDNYQAIKESTEMQIVAMHGIPPILLNIIPANVGGLGDPLKAMQLFYETWVLSVQSKFLEINEEIGEEVVRFSTPEWKLSAV